MVSIIVIIINKTNNSWRVGPHRVRQFLGSCLATDRHCWRYLDKFLRIIYSNFSEPCSSWYPIPVVVRSVLLSKSVHGFPQGHDDANKDIRRRLLLRYLWLVVPNV